MSGSTRARAAALVRALMDLETTVSERQALTMRIINEEAREHGGEIGGLIFQLASLVADVAAARPDNLDGFLTGVVADQLLAGVAQDQTTGGG